MYKLKETTAESIAIASKNNFPNEFLALIGGEKEKKIINELIVLPATYGKNFSTLRTDLIPFDSKILGSVHSHPSTNSFPSSNDLNVFRRFGEIHLIISFPFNIENIRMFNVNGKELKFEVVD